MADSGLARCWGRGGGSTDREPARNGIFIDDSSAGNDGGGNDTADNYDHPAHNYDDAPAAAYNGPTDDHRQGVS